MATADKQPSKQQFSYGILLKLVTPETHRIHKSIAPGELLVEIPYHIHHKSGEEPAQSHYHVYNKPTVTLDDDGIWVCPLEETEFKCLLAIPDCKVRLAQCGKLWVTKCKVGDIVFFHLKPDSATKAWKGRIRYIGEVTDHDGFMFGIEIMDPNFRGKGITDGSPYFYCGHKNAVFVALDKITKHISSNYEGSLPPNTGGTGSISKESATSQHSNYARGKKAPIERAKDNSSRSASGSDIATNTPAPDIPLSFTLGDRAVLHSATEGIVKGIVRWTGPMRISSQCGGIAIPVVGIETSRPVDHEKELPGLCYNFTDSDGGQLFPVTRNHGRIFVSEKTVLTHKNIHVPGDDEWKDIKSNSQNEVTQQFQWKTLRKTLEEKNEKLEAIIAELNEERIQHQTTKQEFAEEVKRHQTTKQELYEEVQKHETTNREFAEEVKQHQTTKQELCEEVQKYEMTNREFAEEVKQHQTTKQELYEEVQKYETTNREFTEEVKQHQTTKREFNQYRREMGRVLEAQQSDIKEQSWKINNEDIQVTSVELGAGGWGSVVVGKYREQKVAVKQLHNIIKSDHNLAIMNREISTMSRLRHPNLLLFIGAVLDHPSGNPLIVTEVMETSLRQAYEKGQLTNDEPSKLSILRDTASGLNYLHCHHEAIIHRDVSSANVLLESRRSAYKWRAKISDFGSANIARRAFTQQMGTAVYSAPETNVPLGEQEQPQTTKVDVYSYGILTCEVMSCQFPESHAVFRTMLSTVCTRSPSIGQMIQDCMKKSPQERPTITDVIHLLDDAINMHVLFNTEDTK